MGEIRDEVAPYRIRNVQLRMKVSLTVTKMIDIDKPPGRRVRGAMDGFINSARTTQLKSLFFLGRFRVSVVYFILYIIDAYAYMIFRSLEPFHRTRY